VRPKSSELALHDESQPLPLPFPLPKSREPN
jgi:hypothetical protein